MLRPYRPHISETLGEFNDRLGWMMLHAPTFADDRGVYADRNVETVFKALNESLDNIRSKLGEARYLAMREMSDRMRAHFEADPEDKTEDSLAGRQIIYEMELMLRRRRGAPG